MSFALKKFIFYPVLFSIFACSSPSNGSGGGAELTSADGALIPVTDPDTGLTLTPIADGLGFPWSMAFLPNGDLLVSEREGVLTLIRKGEKITVSGTPETLVEGQGGYLGLLLDPDFETNRQFYMAFSKGTPASNATAILQAVLSPDGTAITRSQVIYEATKRDTTFHFGGRLQMKADGTLLLTLGDGFRYMDEAQNPANTHGKIIRINRDGSIPTDNPFIGTEGAAPEVYTLGHRNVQGLFIDPETDTIFAHEHGPKGGDEINKIMPGTNYGWPVITYGVNYDGSIITKETTREGLEQPLHKWVPSVAPSGMAKYTGTVYPTWAGDLFIGAMNGPAGQKLIRVDMEEGTIAGVEDLFTSLKIPFRDVAQGPDGKLYLATADLDGAIYRVDP